MLTYQRQFLETCFDDENQEKLMSTIGAILYHDKSVFGKLILILGKPGSGKSSILGPLFRFITYDFSKDIQCIRFLDDAFNILKTVQPDNTKIVIGALHCDEDYILPKINYPADYVIIIHTSGDRIPFEDYKKFDWEMEYFPEEFFHKCMVEFSLNKRYEEQT